MLVCSEESDLDGGRPEGQNVLGVCEVSWVAQPGEEKAEEWPNNSLQLLQGGQQKGMCCTPLSDCLLKDMEAATGEVRIGH